MEERCRAGCEQLGRAQRQTPNLAFKSSKAASGPNLLCCLCIHCSPASPPAHLGLPALCSPIPAPRSASLGLTSS